MGDHGGLESAVDRSSEGSVALERCLKRNGWSQADAAKKLGVLPAMVSRLVHGSRRPGLQLALLVEKVLGIDPKLWNAPPPEGEPTTTSEIRLPSRKARRSGSRTIAGKPRKRHASAKAG